MDSPRLVLQNGSIFDSISTEKVKENHRTALEMGVKIALGTDTPVGNEDGTSARNSIHDRECTDEQPNLKQFPMKK